MKKFIIVFTLVSLAAVGASHADSRRMGSRSLVPTPSLDILYSHQGIVDLTGREALEVEWSREGDPTERYYYDVRIYRGYDTLESSLVAKERVTDYKISLKKQLFSSGQIYTCTIRQVYKNGDKSRKDFASFRLTQ